MLWTDVKLVDLCLTMCYCASSITEEGANVFWTKGILYEP